MADILLNVPYYAQTDSAGPFGYRTCFSSSSSMFLEFLKPGAIHVKPGQQKDDAYFEEHLSLNGDTTNPVAQQETLNQMGINAQFTSQCDWDTVDARLKKGLPTPIGILHKGSADAPFGGHWIVVIGKSADGKYYICHDPAGEADMQNGGYPYGRSGKAVKYTKTNLSKRWLNTNDQKSKTGWAMLGWAK